MELDIRSPHVNASRARLWLNLQAFQQQGVTFEIGQEVRLRERDNTLCCWCVTKVDEGSNSVLCERRVIPMRWAE